ncbi:hypothetical protein GOP47_0010841 [Adiantum capillus-veneris]|uniref:Mechanosensitive ion channel MscS domain-containing protein n=1 Tax=Adiantum capillus-veneris TaxID=13818 RepID=A0A9D4UVB3_ADICA|nr:hypothetical protein GOP47_0010246 [Adiantum capillus-veneris]KAI5074880.1 hypothetical protein GOP47_0010841 [Adiantum capillus-veneris]
MGSKGGYARRHTLVNPSRLRVKVDTCIHPTVAQVPDTRRNINAFCVLPYTTHTHTRTEVPALPHNLNLLSSRRPPSDAELSAGCQLSTPPSHRPHPCPSSYVQPFPPSPAPSPLLTFPCLPSSSAFSPSSPSLSAMHRTSVDEVIVRVESQTASPANGPGFRPSHVPLKDSPQFKSPPSQVIGRNVAPVAKCDSQERRMCEETNDAIWEQFASPDTKRGAGPGIALQGNSSSGSASASGSNNSSGRRPPGSHLSLDRMPGEFTSLGQVQRDGEPRHRSLDLDIHLNEPNLVLLQENVLGNNSKPLSEHLVERDFSFRPKRADAALQQSPPKVVRVSSTTARSNAKPPPSPLQPRSSPVSSVQEEEEEEEVALVETLKSSDSKLAKPDVKLQLPDVYVNPVKTKPEDEARRSGASAMGSPSSGQKIAKVQSLRTVTLSKELLKIKTKSRLVEPPSPAVSVNATSARFGSAKTSAPQSPSRPSVRKGEAELEEEDPFKDIDLQDKFRQGNFKAITLAQWAAFFVVMTCLICSLTVKQVKGRQLWGLELWKWFLLVMVVLCGRLVSGWLIRILVIIFEKNFLLRKKVLYFVYGLRKGVQNCLWLGLVLLAWKLMFDPRVERSKSNHKALVLVTKLLECFLIAAFIWLAKLLLVKSMASSFHVATFFDRIQESLFNQHVLEALSGPPLLDLSFEMETHRPTTISLAKGATKNPQADPAISVQDLQKISQQNVSAGLMKQLMNLVKHPGLGTLVTTFDETVYADDDAEDIEINSELEAKAAAKCIFKNVAQPGSGSIVSQDVLRFVTADEVSRVLCLFEGAKDTGRITKKALKNWVVNVYQERKALALSLNDTKTAVKGLHRMATVVVVVVIVVVWLLVLGIATTHVLLFVSSQLLLVGFMFSNTVKQVFEAIIFLFIMHPFDVGDRCIVDGVQLIVEEMKILSTVFLKADNEKVFYPNSVLATKPISNLYRSPDMKDFLEFSVHISTPAEKITALKERIAVYVEKNSEHWQPKFTVTVKELEDLNRMRLTVSMQHTINFQNFGERLSRRSELLLELKRIFADLSVEYRLLPQTVHFTYPSTNIADSQLPPPVPPLYPYPVPQ